MARALLSIWTWSVLLLVASLGFAATACTFLLCLPFDRNRYCAGRVFRTSARLGILLVPPWHFRASAPYPRRLDRAYVVVSNHESHLDAFLISHLPWEMKWLAKRSLFRLPLIGWCMALAGDVPVVRGARASGQEAMARCRAYLARGMSVFLFPEGTRAVGPEVGPFKLGAFKLAVDADVPVLPLAVAGTRTGLAKGSPWFYPCRAAVTVGAPIEPGPFVAAHRTADGRPDLHAAALALQAAARTQVLALRARLQADAVPEGEGASG